MYLEKIKQEIFPLLFRLIGILHGESDVITFLSVFVPHRDCVISGVGLTKVSNGQSAISPISSALQKRLVPFVVIEAAEQRFTLLEPRGLVLGLVD